ncbi:hypothetical protein ACW0JT_12510 [Arthrobacter sp. SA17]
MTASAQFSIPATNPERKAEPGNPLVRWLLEHRVNQPVGPEAADDHDRIVPCMDAGDFLTVWLGKRRARPRKHGES